MWEATPRFFQAGDWCPECAGTIRLSIAEMQQMAEERGGKCLSDKYVDLSTKVKWQWQRATFGKQQSAILRREVGARSVLNLELHRR
ncbi:MAG: hypothetical protein Ct9H90mP25_3650 [Gammaproteobacteria bacterium]|nr:MAG: hypothetical protein Ct9H90mP25_3650 [Gammaproteobacteria bacterium]